MVIAYVENFRGFKSAEIPLRDVNFLVGENSTGKSSILAAIALLASPPFWFQQDFNADEVRLGSFNDIVSIDAADRSSFALGFYGYRERGKNQKPLAFAFMLRFVESEGLPIVKSYDLLRDRQIFRCLFEKRSVYYETGELAEDELEKGGAMRLFRRWSQEGLSARRHPKKVKKIVGPRRQVLPILDAIIRSTKEGVNELSSLRGVLHIPFGPVAWIAPIRTKPRRTYDEPKSTFSADGGHIPYLIRRLGRKSKQGREFAAFLHDFGSSSGLFRALTPRGFGDSPNSPFALEVVVGKKPLTIDNVGYGVSQALPVAVEAFTRSKDSYLSIQQPEVHLHPRAQAALGDLFFRMATREKKKFFIETHSDFTIDRFRLNYLHAQSVPAAQVLFFSRDEAGNHVSAIPINDNGSYSEEQPRQFRDFFLKEQLSLLGVE
jgi:hypothetical protein